METLTEGKQLVSHQPTIKLEETNFVCPLYLTKLYLLVLTDGGVMLRILIADDHQIGRKDIKAIFKK